MNNASLWLNALSLAFFITGLILTLKGSAAIADAPRYAAWIRFGPLFFGLPLVIFGLQHFALPNDVIGAVPSYMPARMFWVYFVGTALIAAAISLITNRMTRWAALLLGILFLLFVLMIYIPIVVRNPHSRFLWALFCRDFSLSASAFALAGTLALHPDAPAARIMRIVGRYIFAAVMVFFGVEHFPHPHYAPGVPLEMMLPAWMPAHAAWAWVTGAILVVCGLSILLNQRPSLAAVVLGVTYLALVLFIYVPMEIAHPSIQISGELDYVVDTLIFSGAAFFIARSILVPSSTITQA